MIYQFPAYPGAPPSPYPSNPVTSAPLGTASFLNGFRFFIWGSSWHIFTIVRAKLASLLAIGSSNSSGPIISQALEVSIFKAITIGPSITPSLEYAWAVNLDTILLDIPQRKEFDMKSSFVISTSFFTPDVPRDFLVKLKYMFGRIVFVSRFQVMPRNVYVLSSPFSILALTSGSVSISEYVALRGSPISECILSISCFTKLYSCSVRYDEL